MKKHYNNKSKGYGSMGVSKHRKSGKVPKSPKLRFHMSLEARKNERKASPPLPHENVTEVFRSQS